MRSYLRGLCTNLGIKLIYTTNKITVLSCFNKNETITIRAHNIFQNCSKEVSIAIIEYYSNLKDQKENLNIIEKYVKENFNEKNFKIQSSNKLCKELFNKNIPAKEVVKNHLTQVSEYRISSITQTDFYGKKSIIKPQETFKPLSNEILELDITILPSST